MKVLLDTDTCIHLIRYQPAAMQQRLKRYEPGDVGISSITLAELSFGAEKSQQRERNRAALHDFTAALEIAPFDAAAAAAYGEVRAMLDGRGTRIGSLDTLIGAHALSLKVTLVTHNTREFSRISGLRLADWVEKSS
ncbi:MAG: type II toxin-antitoxin system VapC family toxin [Bryobacteraceae bacterium]|jgi:tRNA(fMet)-specific endonuclease VapC